MNAVNRSLSRSSQRSASSASATSPLRQALRARWTALQPRERLLLGAAACVALLALLWLVAIAPALSVLRTAPTQIALLENQRQQMTALAREADALRGQTSARPADARAALTTTTQNSLGQRGKISGTGDQAQVALEQAQASEWLDWLAQARINARVTPVEAELTAASGGQWKGTLAFTLPLPAQ